MENQDALEQLIEKQHHEIQQLKHTKAKYNATLDAIAGIHWRKDMNGVYTDCNQAMVQALGLQSKKDIIGKTDYDLAWNAHAEALAKNDNLVLKTGLVQTATEETVTTASGDGKTFIVSKAPIFDESNNIIGTVGNSIDITAQKQAEKALIQSNQSRRAFLEATHHLIRTPLSTLLGAAELLKTEDYDLDQHIKSTHLLIQSVKEVTWLLDQVGYYLDLDQGELTPYATAIHFKPYIQSQYQYYKKMAQNKKLEMTLSYDEKLPVWLSCDKHFLTQVLTNLLSNAVKFTETGTISLCVRQKEIIENKMNLEIKIRDTGIGMTEQQLEYLFNLFDKPTMGFNNNTAEPGLNLSISAKMIRMMGGTIQALSQSQKGSTFIINLPVHFTEPPATKPSQKQLLPITDGYDDRMLDILIIEDHPLAQDMLTLQLNKLCNCKIERAYHLNSALTHLNKPYDLILTDLHLPDGTTHSFIQQYHAAFPSIPILVVTAYITQREHEKLLNKGVLEILHKPVSMEALKYLLTSYIICDG